MEIWHIVFFDDAEAVIDITFPDFRRDGCTSHLVFFTFLSFYPLKAVVQTAESSYF